MKITRKLLTQLGACEEGKEWALALPTDDPIEVIKALNKRRVDWANWLLTRLLTPYNAARYAVYVARQALPIFEEERPDDDRPRKTIEAAERYLKNPTKVNARAIDAARVAHTVDDAARAASLAVAYAVLYVATSATYVAPAAARAADRAAAYAARAGIPKSKLINYGLRLLRHQLKGE